MAQTGRSVLRVQYETILLEPHRMWLQAKSFDKKAAAAARAVVEA